MVKLTLFNWQRYSQKDKLKKLPNWMQQHLPSTSSNLATTVSVLFVCQFLPFLLWFFYLVTFEWSGEGCCPHCKEVFASNGPTLSHSKYFKNVYSSIKIFKNIRLQEDQHGHSLLTAKQVMELYPVNEDIMPMEQ